MISRSRLKKVLAYDPQTGIFTWKIGLSYRGKAGTVAGCLNSDGYVEIGIDRKRYYGHRLAWLYVHGVYPEKTDHKDLNRSNNRISNLRCVSQSGNAQNVRKARSSNKLGLLGVSLHKASGLFKAQVILNRKVRYAKYFKTPQAAYVGYLGAKRRLHEMCTL